jgi:hypothetical protein
MENGLEEKGRSTDASPTTRCTMTRTKKLGFGVVLLHSLVACGAAGTDERADGDESVAEVSEALNETAMDRPMAAAIPRGLGNNESEIWVFACGADNKMRRRVGNSFGYFGNRWFTLGDGHSCASPPSVARWRQMRNEPGGPDTLLVYWRDLNDNLIEVGYNSDGSASTTNLSEYTGFGPIAGSPVVANAIHTDGAVRRVSVAVVKAGTEGELYTLDFYQGSWKAPRPVLLDAGVTATVMPGTSIVAAHGAGNGGDAFLSIQHNAGSHFIFKRRYWSNSYLQYAWTASSPNGLPKGVLGFVNGGNQYQRCPGDFCAVVRDPTTNRPKVADLSTGGDITSRFAYPPGTQVFPPPVQPPLASSVSTRQINITPMDLVPVALTNGHVGYLSWTGRVVDSSFGSGVVSQPFSVERLVGHILYTAGPTNTLHYLHLYDTSVSGSLELDVAR